MAYIKYGTSEMFSHEENASLENIGRLNQLFPIKKNSDFDEFDAISRNFELEFGISDIEVSTATSNIEKGPYCKIR